MRKGVTPNGVTPFITPPIRGDGFVAFGTLSFIGHIRTFPGVYSNDRRNTIGVTTQPGTRKGEWDESFHCVIV